MDTNSVVSALQSADPSGEREVRFLVEDSSYTAVTSGDIAAATVSNIGVVILNVNHPSTLPPA